MKKVQSEQSRGSHKPGPLSKLLSSLAEPREFNFTHAMKIT